MLTLNPRLLAVWNEIGERTLKAQVQHELFLPPQARFIVPVDLTAVERFYYDQRYADALGTLGLAIDGTPQVGADVAWTPDRSEMIRALETLRQLAMHPQVGAVNRCVMRFASARTRGCGLLRELVVRFELCADLSLLPPSLFSLPPSYPLSFVPVRRGKLSLGRVVRTVAEVHAVMLDKAVGDIQGAQRAMLLARVRRAQYLCWDEDVEGRFETALELFGSAVDELDPVIDEVSDEVHRVWKERKKDDVCVPFLYFFPSSLPLPLPVLLYFCSY